MTKYEFIVAEDNVLGRVLEHHEYVENFYGEGSVFATMLYGSQNYGLSTPESDVDTKVLLLPNFREFTLNKKWTSTEHAVGDGLSNVKDVRAMFENFLKSNINFLETLFSKFVVWNMTYDDYWQDLQDHRNVVANANPRKLLHAAAGMAAQKYHALEKPFESKVEVLAKYGYDPKQLHHLVRLRHFMAHYLVNTDFELCLKPTEYEFEYLIGLKKYPVCLEEARALANKTLAEVDGFVERANSLFEAEPVTAERAKEYLDNLACELLAEHLKRQLQ